MIGESLSIQQDNLEKLKQIFPQVFSEGGLDWEKLKATFSDDIIFSNERYVLNWAGKSDAFKVLQIPTTATLRPSPEESINFDTTQNIFIEGENLEVLKVLQKAYYGKIKCIIIDPPYNTGSDSFIYPDSFKESKADYEKRIGDKDEEGYLMKEGLFRKNSKDSGHFHSNWLSMMYPRLFLAKNLLRDDGVIFVHIDDNEVHNLRLMMNEIFGEENFVASIIWQKRTAPDARTLISEAHDYILVFSKRLSEGKNTLNAFPLDESRRENYSNPDSDPRGDWASVDLTGQTGRAPKSQFYTIVSPSGKEFPPPKGRCWALAETTFYELLKDNRIWFGKDGNSRPRLKKFLAESEGQRPWTWWDNKTYGHNQEGNKEVMALFEGNLVFDNPKPVRLIKKILQLATSNNSNDIVLDFFGGSGTTAEAVIQLNREDSGNRRFIIVQLPELTEIGGNDFQAASVASKLGYKTISDVLRERIRRVIKKVEKEKTEKPDMFDDGELDLGLKVFKLSSSNFKIWRGNEITEENLVQQLDVFADPANEGSQEQDILHELMLKAGYLLTDKVEAKDEFYSIRDGELIIVLTQMNETVINQIIAARPKKVITLDKLFISNDQLKTNTVLQMRDAGIDFKTI